MPVLPYAEWRPDVAENNGSYASLILNVLCADGSYLPFPQWVAFTEALPDKPLGGLTARSLAGQITIFAATGAKIYRYDPTDRSWDDVSKPMTTYAASETSRWSFSQFGSFVIAVNQNDDPQVFDLDGSSTFDDLGGSPPRAAFVRVWGDFVALMGLTSNPNRVQWSGLNDCEFWTPGSQNSDFQDFGDGGIVQGSNDATNPIILQERAIRRGVFVPGSVEVFTFAKIHDARGAKAPYSIAARGSYTFFADEGGFFQIGADGQISPIGFERVDRTIFGTMASTDIAEIRGVVDPFYSRVYWAVDSTGSGNFNAFIVYDWNLGRWTRVNTTIVLPVPTVTVGYTLDGLDAIVASLDELTITLDSKVWQGGAPLLGAFDTSYRFGFYNGTNAEAILQTQESGDVTGGVTTIRSMYPVVDTDGLFISVGSRLRRKDAYVWTNEGQPSRATGRVLKKSRGRFHVIKTRIPVNTDWQHAQAIDVDLINTGTR